MVEVKEVNEVIASLGVIDNTFGHGNIKGKTNVFNFVNFDNSAKFKQKKLWQAKVSER